MLGETTKLRLEWVEVTPSLATELTKPLNMPVNRRLNPSTTDAYVTDMRAGDFINIGDSFSIGPQGQTLDGQHRSEALKIVNDSMMVLFVHNVDAGDQGLLDGYKRATAAEKAAVKGMPHSSVVTSAIRLAIAYEAGLLQRAVSIYPKAATTSQIARYRDAHGDEIAPHATRWNRGAGSDGGSHGAATIFVALTLSRLAPIDVVDEYLDRVDRWITGGSPGCPIEAVRYRLRGAHKSRERGFSPIREAHVLFKGWNAWISGEPLSRKIPVVLRANQPVAFCVPLPWDAHHSAHVARGAVQSSAGSIGGRQDGNDSERLLTGVST